MHCDGYMAELLSVWIEADFNCCYPEVAAGNDIVAYRHQYGERIAYASSSSFALGGQL
jgi:hypothetical protein